MAKKGSGFYHYETLKQEIQITIHETVIDRVAPSPTRKCREPSLSHAHKAANGTSEHYLQNGVQCCARD